MYNLNLAGSLFVDQLFKYYKHRVGINIMPIQKQLNPTVAILTLKVSAPPHATGARLYVLFMQPRPTHTVYFIKPMQFCYHYTLDILSRILQTGAANEIRFDSFCAGMIQ